MSRLLQTTLVAFRHQLPGPNAKTATRRPLNALYEVWSQLGLGPPSRLYTPDSGVPAPRWLWCLARGVRLSVPLLAASRLLPQREGKAERGPLLRLRQRPDLAAMRGDNGLTNGQAEPAASAFVVKKGVNICCIVVSSIPLPVSVSDTRRVLGS